MLSGIQYHFGAAQDCLGSKLIGHGAGHTALHSGIRHSFYEHENICRGAAADCGHDIKQFLADLLHLAEGAAEPAHGLNLFRSHPFVCTGRRHSCAHQGRRIGHQTDQAHRIVPEALLDPGDGTARRDTDKQMLRSCRIADPENDILQVLRFDSQENDIRISDDLRIVGCHAYAALRLDLFPRFGRQIRTCDILRQNCAGCNDSADNCAGHVSTSDKAKFHCVTSCDEQ